MESTAARATASDRVQLTDALKPYVSSYIWDTANNADKRARVLEALHAGNAFVEEEFMTVVMYDISGYSSITADLSNLGKLSSEVITSTVNSFFKTLINVIHSYGGDIVKFLGDALLVSFAKSRNDEPVNEIIERAVTCSIHIIQYHATLTIDLNAIPTETGKLSRVDSVISQTLRRSAINGSKKVYNIDAERKTIQLGMHVAVTSGLVQRVIVGKPSVRTDYTLLSPCFSNLSELLDGTVSLGEIGIDRETMDKLSAEFGAELRRCCTCDSRPFYTLPKDGFYDFIDFRGTPEYQTMSKTQFSTMAVSPAATILPAATISEDSGSSEADAYVSDMLPRKNKASSEALDMASMFVNTSILWKAFKPAKDGGASFQRRGTIHSDSLKVEQGMDLRRSSTVRAVAGVEGNSFTPEFRKVTILFAKLPYNIRIPEMNTIFTEFVTQIKVWHGVIQQLSVDDKGRTILAIFGLPVKGKIDPIKVYAVNLNSESRIKHSLSVGYRAEKTALNEAITSYLSEKKKAVCVLEGTGGMGKTNLVEFCIDLLPKETATYCLTTATEIEKWTPFFALRTPCSLLLKLWKGLWQDSNGVSGGSQSIITRRSSSTIVIHTSSANQICHARTSSRQTLSESNLIDTKALKALLAQLGEDPDLVPLLSVVYPKLNQEDNDLTSSLDHSTRKATLKKIIVSAFKYVTSHFQSTVFLFDDAHLYDPMSFEIILALVQECPTICMLFFARPESEVDYLAKVIQVSGVQHFKLQGFSASETHEFISKKLAQSVDVKTVDSKIVNAIFERTKGHPMEIDLLVDLISAEREQYGIGNASGGILAVTNEDLLSASLKTIDVSGMTMVQFDELDEDFKEYLRKASIMGQYFSESDLVSIFNVEPVGDRTEWIKSLDKYGFLVLPDRSSSSSAKPDEVDKMVDDHDEYKEVSGDGLCYSFRNVTSMSAIYSSQSFEERAQRHSDVTAYYETLLTPANEDYLLPLLTFHYSKTSETKKHIKYLEKLGLKTLVDCLDDSQLVRKLPSLDSVRQADWIAHYIFVLAQQKVVDKVLPLAYKALKLLGDDFPQSKEGVERRLWRTMFRLGVLWNRTNAGLKPCKTKGVVARYMHVGESGHGMDDSCLGQGKCIECPRLRRAQSVIFRSMFQSAAVLAGVSMKTLGLILFEGCCADIKTSAFDRGEFVVSCYRTAFGVYTAIPFAANLLLKAAANVESKRKLGDAAHFCFHTTSFLYFARNEMDKAVECSKAAAAYFLKRGDVPNVMAAKAFETEYPFWVGDMAKSLEIVQPYLNKASFRVSPVWSIFIAQLASRVYIFQGDNRKCNEVAELLDFFIKLLPPLPMFQSYPSYAHLVRGFQALQQADYPKALKHFIDICNLLKSLEVYSNVIAEMKILSSLLIFLILTHYDQPIPAESQYDPRLREALRGIHVRVRMYAKSNRYVQMWWADKIYDAADECRQRRTNGKKYSPGASSIVKALRRTKAKEVNDLQKLPMLEAMVLLVAGHILVGTTGAPASRSLRERDEGKAYLEKSSAMFTSFGAACMAQWAKLT
ncbi:hypothetical protein HDV05_004937 [Chytridiales sp. JEL 0842]|nr:hypothetical protein HDV05_004937 [Chytridiales sp. JEL 0842]